MKYKKKGLFPHLKQNIHTENQKFFQKRKTEKNGRSWVLKYLFDLLSSCIFIFFWNKQHESNRDLKHEMQINWLQKIFISQMLT